MVLKIEDTFIYNKSSEISTDYLYSNFPSVAEKGKKFARQNCRSVQGSEGVAYIRQKEDIVTFFGDKFDDGTVVKKVGTQDVLTCNVVTLRHQATGVTAFAHFDEYLRQQRLEAFVEKFKTSVFHRTYYGYEDEDYDPELWEWDELEEEDEEEESQEVDQELYDNISLQLVGGYKEESGKGGLLSKRILTFFASHPLTFDLTLACLGPLNTRIRSRPEPIVGGILCDLRKATLHPATFNRSFVDGLPDDAVMSLMLGPSLLKRPETLKKMIIEQEDKGYRAKTSMTM